MRRYPMKRDLAEPEIVRVLERAGWQVFSMFILNGPDLVALKGKRAVFIECKTGKADLSPGQREFHADWRGPTIRIVRSQAEAIQFVQEQR